VGVIPRPALFFFREWARPRRNAIQESRADIRKRLLLILARNDRAFWGKVTRGKTGFARLSLPTVAGLTPPDWEVTIHDSRASPVDSSQDVDLVGITAFTAEIPSAYEIADAFRRRGVSVILGGIHVSALPDEGLQHADAVVIGEAENVWAQALEDFAQGRLQRTYRSPGFCDLQHMVWPRRDLLDRRMYQNGFRTIEATRGCPFDCDYCAVTGVFGRRYRTRPVADVIAEINAFDRGDIFFVDDNICGRPAYAKELFRALIPLKRAWGGQTSITFARDAELLDLYARSGGRYAFIGFESLSEGNLRNINKQWNHPDAYGEAIRRIHDAGINILGSFIFGLDGDDPSVFDRTFEFVMKHRIDAVQYHILTPFPGTRLYDAMEAQGRIIERDWSRYHTSEVVFRPRQMTPRQLQDGYFRVFRRTYSVSNIARRVFARRRGMLNRLVMNISYRKKAMRMPRPSQSPSPAVLGVSVLDESPRAAPPQGA